MKVNNRRRVKMSKRTSAIIVLCVIKPSDKKVEEVDIEKLKGKKKSKKD